MIRGPAVFWIAVKKDPSVSVLYPHTFLPCSWGTKDEYVKESFQEDPKVFAMNMWAFSCTRKVQDA